MSNWKNESTDSVPHKICRAKQWILYRDIKVLRKEGKSLSVKGINCVFNDSKVLTESCGSNIESSESERMYRKLVSS